MEAGSAEKIAARILELEKEVRTLRETVERLVRLMEAKEASGVRSVGYIPFPVDNMALEIRERPPISKEKAELMVEAALDKVLKGDFD